MNYGNFFATTAGKSTQKAAFEAKAVPCE